jgi:hypothetical protein
VETQQNFLGRSERSVPKLIQKPSSPRRVDQLERLSESASPAKYVVSVWNMRWRMMSDLGFGVASPSGSVVASSVVLRS